MEWVRWYITSNSDIFFSGCEWPKLGSAAVISWLCINRCGGQRRKNAALTLSLLVWDFAAQLATRCTAKMATGSCHQLLTWLICVQWCIPVIFGKQGSFCRMQLSSS